MKTARISWTSVGATESVERCTVEHSDDGIRIIGEVEGGDHPCRYALRLDADGVFDHAAITAGEREVVIERTPQGWRVDGVARPDLADATDIDIVATPATNTLPIRRLGLPVGGRAEIQVAWVSVPELDVRLAAQRYTRVGPRAYCYESADGGFRRTLTVDGDGFVLSYPGLFERVTGS